jgi:thiol-disulfide isomerase/thioredoxin
MILVHTQCKTKKGELTASLTNIPDSTVLNIIDLDNGRTLAKISVFDNKFEFSYRFESPKKILITEDNPKYPKYQKILWIENSKITISGNYDYFVNAKVEGSASNAIQERFDTLVRKFENKLADLRLTARISNDQQVKDSIEKEIQKIKYKHIQEKSQLYLENIQSNVAWSNLEYEVSNYFSVLSKNDISKIYSALPEKVKLNDKGLIIKKFISLPEVPNIGEKFIDCLQKTPDGKTEAISQNLGKYTIIEFWASSCAPCRAKHPLMKKMYDQYHSRGLNIISISGDDNIDDWVKAIKRDSMTWTNISDLRGWYNEAFMIYGIKAIPQMLILDENGLIVDTQFDIQYLVHTPDLVFKNQKIKSNR